MSLHYGAIVEMAVRRKSVNISEISRRMHVNRRSIYNWFQKDFLSIEIICEIGYIIDHDFSKDFPAEFAPDGFANPHHSVGYKSKRNGEQDYSVRFWMNKYIALLEKYNNLLMDYARETQAKDGTDPP